MNASSPLEPIDREPRRAWLAAVLIALATFLAFLPTLRWPQFTGGNENIVVATALQMRQGGPWLVPHLDGEPRVKKPPLVAWITAAALRQSTLDALDSPDADVRRAAYVDLALEVRWTGVAAGCVLMLATFALARALGGAAVGIAATMIVATNFLFLKFMRQSTTDVHLAMWVTIANACFTVALLHRRWWLAATLGSLATAMAFLCKGPVALLETVLPLIVGIVLVRRMGDAVGLEGDAGSGSAGSGAGGLSARGSVGMRVVQAGVGVGVFGLVALPWFVHVLNTVPGVWSTWFTEVTREGATDLEPGNPATYLLLSPMMWPWLVFGVIGLVLIARQWRDPRRLLPVLQILLPLSVMVLFRDRKDRYLLPMIAPAATICAFGLVAWINDWRRRDRTRFGREQWLLTGHVLLLLGGAIGLACAGMAQPAVDGGTWWTPAGAIVFSLMFLVLAALGCVLQRRAAWAMAGATFATMLLLQAIFMLGYARSAPGTSAYAPLAEVVRAVGPHTRVYDFDYAGEGDRVPEEISLYLNRPIHPAGRPEDIRPAPDGPTVLLIRQRKGQADPTLPPPWQAIGSATEKRTTWWAFLLPPGNPG